MQFPRFPRLRTRLTREGWYFLAVLGFVLTGSLLREINLMLVLAGMMLGPLLLSRYVVWKNLRGLTLSRKLPPAVSVGDSLAVEVAVANPRRRLPAWSLWIDDAINSDSAGRRVARGQTLIAHVPSGGSRSAVYRWTPTRRGRYTLGPLRLVSRFPLGLLQRAIVHDMVEPIVVFPKAGRLTAGWRRLLAETAAAEERGRTRRQSAEGDFYGLREWRSGDSRRAVHWRTSARRGQLMVRQFEQPRQHDFALLLDLWSPANSVVSPDVERAIRFAATVLAELCRHPGGAVTLAAGGATEFRVSGAPSAKLHLQALNELALIEPGNGHQYTAWAADTLAELPAHTAVVLVTTRTPADFAVWRKQSLREQPATRQPAVRVLHADRASLAELFREDRP